MEGLFTLALQRPRLKNKVFHGDPNAPFAKWLVYVIGAHIFVVNFCSVVW